MNRQEDRKGKPEGSRDYIGEWRKQTNKKTHPPANINTVSEIKKYCIYETEFLKNYKN